jgi:hypothetical protein
MERIMTLPLLLASLLVLQQIPQVSVTPIQVERNLQIEVAGTGFTPGRFVTSHLLRPGQIEEGVLRFPIDARGRYSHEIDSSLLPHGTYDLWAVDDASGAMSNVVRFTVGFDPGKAVLPEVQGLLSEVAGVWRGSAARNNPAVRSDVLVAISAGEPGPVAGTIAYPSLSCGAVLKFRAVYTDAIELAESASWGERCVTNGIVRLKAGPDGNLTFEWRHPNVPEVSTGTVTRLR